ncbi:hypothetical protein KR093_001060, partial [Drosophila rubida]
FGMRTVFNASHWLLDFLLTHNPAIPDGYISIKRDGTLSLGQKVEFNDWHDLVAEYLPLFIWLVLLLIIIVLMPLGAIIIAFANRLLDRGMQEGMETVRRGNEDVCIYLKDTNNHIHHLFSHNYEELYNHINQIMMGTIYTCHSSCLLFTFTFTFTSTDGEHHLTMDVVDVSGATALAEMERILDNMPEALEVMRELNDIENEMRFLGDQLRDGKLNYAKPLCFSQISHRFYLPGIRTIKRNINSAYSYVGMPYQMYRFLRDSMIEFVDTSRCLHFDEMPDTDVYVQGIEEIIEGKYADIPKQGVQRFKTISDAVKVNVDRIGPMVMIDMGHGRDIMLRRAVEIQNLIDAVISDLHLNSIRTAKSFEDFYNKYSKERSIVNSIAWIFILLVSATM